MLDFSYDLTASGGVTSTFRQPNHLSIRGAFMAIHQLPPLGVDSQSLTCKQCEAAKPINAFYVSNLSRCKECVKASVRASRAENIDYYRSYDRARYRDEPHRKENARACANSEAAKASKQRYAERVKGQPERQARVQIGNAIRSGKLKRGDSCFFCASSDKLQAHHHDYSKPLDVFWLCPPCHGKLHTINGDFHRPKPNEAL